MDKVQTTTQTFSRKGQKWTSQEDDELLDELASGNTINELSVIHQRTENAISLRLVKHAEAFIQAGATNEEACEKYNITQELLDVGLPKRIPLVKSKKPRKAKKPPKAKRVIINPGLSYRDTFDKIEIVVNQLVARELIENPALTKQEIFDMLQESFDEINTDILNKGQD